MFRIRLEGIAQEEKVISFQFMKGLKDGREKKRVLIATQSNVRVYRYKDRDGMLNHASSYEIKRKLKKLIDYKVPAIYGKVVHACFPDEMDSRVLFVWLYSEELCNLTLKALFVAQVSKSPTSTVRDE